MRSDSLKARITVPISLLLVILLGIGGASLLWFTRIQVEETVVQQQKLVGAALGGEIAEKIRSAQASVAGIAAAFHGDLAGPESRLAGILREHADGNLTFDNGVYLFAASGRMLAGTAIEPGMLGRDYGSRDYFRRTMVTRRSQVSQPFTSIQRHGHPIVMVTAPVLGKGGVPVGIVAGSLDLLGDNFIGRIAGLRIGSRGYLTVVGDDGKVIVTGSPQGAAGGAEAAALVRAGGAEAGVVRGGGFFLTSRRIPAVGWTLVSAYPVAEAFTHLRHAWTYLFGALIVALVLSVGVVLLLVRRLTFPLERLTDELRRLADENGNEELVSVSSCGEIGTLTEIFNHLLGRLRMHREQLAAQVAFLQGLIDAIPLPVFYKTRDGVYLGCNRAFEAETGVPRQQLIGKDVAAAVPLWLVDEHRRADAELLRTGERQAYQTISVSADNSRRIIMAFKDLITGMEDGPGIVGTLVDITELKEVEAAMQAQKELTEKLIENSSVPTFVINSSRRVLFWNRSCEEVTGVPAAEVIGTDRHWRGFYEVPQDCLADVILQGDEGIANLAHYQKFVVVGDRMESEGWFSGAGGRRYLLSSAAPVRSGDGEIVAVIETVQDLTERKLAEEALQRSEARFRALCDFAPVGIYECNADGFCTYSNEFLLDYLGLQDGDLPGDSWMRAIHPEDLPRVKAGWEALGAGGKKWSSEYRVVGKSGETRWVRSAAGVITGSLGERIGYVGVAEDITDQKVSREALVSQSTRLQLLNAALRDLHRVLDPRVVIRILLRSALEVSGGAAATFGYLKGDSLHFTEYHDAATGEILPVAVILDPAALPERVFRQRLTDVQEGEALVPSAIPAGEDLAVRAQVTVPVPERNGGVAGCLLVYFTEGDQTSWSFGAEMLENLASGAAIALENAGSLEELQATKRSLIMARDFYLTLFEEFPALIWRCGTDGKCNYFNRGWLDYTGRSLDAEMGDGWTEGVHPDDLQSTWDVFMEAFRRKDPFSMVYRLRRHDGSYGWIIDNGRPFSDIDGEFAGYIGACFDVTDRIEAFDKIRKLSWAVEQSPSSIIITGAGGEIEYVNPKFTALTGYLPEEVVGRRPAIFGEGDSPGGEVWRTISGGREWRGEFLSRKKSGEEYWEKALIAPMTETDGRIANYIAVKEDITERKAAEDELRRTLSLLNATLEATADGILAVQLTGGIAGWNRQFLDMWRIPESAIGTMTGDDLMTHFLTEVAAPEEFLAAGSLVSDRPESEIHDTVLLADGRVFDRFSRPERVGEAIIGRVWSFRDVTAHRKLEEQVRVVQKLEAVATLTGGIAHDFNNILTIINGYSALMKRHSNPEKLREFAAKIAVAGDRGSELTQQLLAFSRMQVMEPRVLDLNRVIRNIEGILHGFIREDIQLHLELPEPISAVKADQTQLEQIIINLVVNARDAMPTGGELIITTGETVFGQDFCSANPGSTPGKYVFCAITDSGEGMTDEVRQRIFEPFFSTKEQGKGTGLGLATVYGIVKQNRGYITVTSSPGDGSRFRVFLPAEDAVAEAVEPAPKGEVTGGTETLLVVEDQEHLLDLAVQTLRPLGYRVVPANRPEEALRVAESGERIDLLVTDVVMPEMGGVELARAVRDILPDIGVLYMSGYAESMRVVSAGMMFLQKPFTPEGLAAKVRAALDSRKEVGS